MPRKEQALKPLRQFDYSLIAAPLDGLLFNIDRGMEKSARWAQARAHYEHERELGLLMVLLRFGEEFV